MRNVLRIVYAVAAVAAVAVLCVKPVRLDTGVFGMAGDGAGGILGEMLERNSNRVRVLVEAKNFRAAKRGAKKVSEFFGPNAQWSMVLRGDGLSKLLGVYAAHSGGLLAEEDFLLLKSGGAGERKIYERAKARMLAPYGVSMFKARDDPFFLLDGFVAEKMRFGAGQTANGAPARKFRDGFAMFSSADGGHSNIVMVCNTQNISDADFDVLMRGLDAFKEALGKDGVKAHFSSPRMHAYYAARSTMAEVNVLSAVSVVLVCALAFAAFRSFRVFAPMVAGFGVSFLAAVACLVLFFERPHAAVLLFATSLIGLSIDYSYHFFFSYGAQKREAADIRKKMFYSFATTEFCFLSLLFSSFALLRQIAVFSAAGIAASFAFVMLFYPAFLRGARLRKCAFSPRVPRACAVGRAVFTGVFVLVAVAGLFMFRAKTDVSALYKPPSILLADDIAVSKAFGDAKTPLAIIEGGSVAEIIEREEAHSVRGISMFVPSARRQAECRELVERFYAKYADSFFGDIGAKVGFVPNVRSESLELGDLEGTIAWDAVSAMLFDKPDGKCAVVPFYGDPSGFSAADGMRIAFVPELLDETFGAFTAQTSRFLAFAIFATAVLFAVFFGRRALLLGLPILIAQGIAVFAITLACGGVNVFCMLALYMMLGIGVDYCVFNIEGASPHARTAALFAFLTSFFGFGMLYFTSFAAVSALGGTLAAGLGIIYAVSLLLGHE